VIADGELFAVYFSDRWQIGDAWTAELGWRWDKQGYTDTPNERQISPRFSVLHDLGERTDLRFGFGRYFQSQGIHELQVEDGVTQFATAQRTDQAVLGVQHRFSDHYSVRAEAYFRALRQLRPRFENVFDPLAVIPELEPYRVRIAPERGFARGVEVSVAYTGADELSWWASYVLSRVEDRIAGVDVLRSWDQRHAMQFGAAWDGGRWDLAAALNVHSGWPTTGVTLEGSSLAPVAVIGTRNALRLGSFASLDLRASRTAPLRVGSLDFFVEISNATDRANPCCGDFDLEEDSTGNLLLERDTEHWLPRLGSVGVVWKF
jgi:outer membrane receptor protein involved in Fe transport